MIKINRIVRIFSIVIVSTIVFLVIKYWVKEESLEEKSFETKLLETAELKNYQPVMDVNVPSVWLKKLDINGDGILDSVGAITHKDDPAIQLPLVIWGDGEIEIVNRSSELEFPRVELIEVVSQEKLKEHSIDTAIKGDAFIVYKLDASSSLIYWDGKKFRFHWLGD